MLGGIVPAFPSVLVASDNDDWMDADRAGLWASRWGSQFVNLGAAGHINVRSGHQHWREGLDLLERLCQRVVEIRLS